MTSYLFALIDAGGTVAPELGAASRLVQRGHTVNVIAEESMREEVVAAGATFSAWTGAVNRPDRRPENDPLHDWDIRSPRELFARISDDILIGPAPQFASDVMAKIRDGRPDVVVCSFFTVGAMVAAEATGIPYVVLMANIYGLPARGMPPFGLGLRPRSGPLGRLRDSAINAMVRRQWNRELGRLNALRKSNGLQRISDVWDEVRQAAKVLVLTSATFDFPAQVPGNTRYVGAVLDDPAWADRPWTPPPGEDPLVLVAMSSTFQDHVDALQRCIDALASLPVRGIVTTGQAVDPSQLRAAPNVSVVAAAPHSRVLKHAAVVLTHGGHGTVMRSLAAGVPMVVMPLGRDQFDNAVRVDSRGAAITVSRDADAGTIADAVRKVLADGRYRRAAERMGESIRADAASGALVAELEGVRSGQRVGESE